MRRRGVGDRNKRFEWHMQHLLGAEGILEYLIGVGERLIDIATAEVEVKRDIRISLALQILEVRKGAGGLELLVHYSLRGHRLDLVVNGWQLLIVGDDELGSFFGHMRVSGERDGDGLSDIADLVHGENRLVVECWPVKWMGDDRADVIRGDNALDAG